MNWPNVEAANNTENIGHPSLYNYSKYHRLGKIMSSCKESIKLLHKIKIDDETKDEIDTCFWMSIAAPGKRHGFRDYSNVCVEKLMV